MQQHRFFPHADRGDEAIDGAPDGVASAPGRPIQLGGVEMVVGRLERQHGEGEKARADEIHVTVTPEALKDLGEAEIDDADLGIGSDELAKQHRFGGRDRVEVVDPNAGVDDDHRVRDEARCREVALPVHLALEVEHPLTLAMADELAQCEVDRGLLGRGPGDLLRLGEQLVVDFDVRAHGARGYTRTRNSMCTNASANVHGAPARRGLKPNDTIVIRPQVGDNGCGRPVERDVRTGG